MKLFAAAILMFGAGAAAADTIIATRNIRPGTVLVESDLSLASGEVPGAFDNAGPIIGQEALVALYAGRPILVEHVGRAAIVERNQLVQIVFLTAGLMIKAEGRALGRGAEGDRIRVMNLTSKSSLFGTIQTDGTVRVSQ
ncbi:MAG: flagellar basal body P-ring formation chaperone FlgA [Paracoccaceae bacterium]